MQNPFLMFLTAFYNWKNREINMPTDTPMDDTRMEETPKKDPPRKEVLKVKAPEKTLSMSPRVPFTRALPTPMPDRQELLRLHGLA